MVKKASILSSTKKTEKKITSQKDIKSNLSKASLATSNLQSTKNIKFPKIRSTKKPKNKCANTPIRKHYKKEAGSEDQKSNFSDDFFRKQLLEAIKVINLNLSFLLSFTLLAFFLN